MRCAARLAALLVAGTLWCVPGGAAASNGTLNLFGWPRYVPLPVLDEFTDETGIEVRYETYDTNEALVAGLRSRAGRYDLVMPSEHVVEALVKAGGLERLDHAKLPNLRHVAPEFRGLPHDPTLEYSVPYLSGTVGIVRNTSRVPEPVRGYADVFQQRYGGRIVVIDDAREIVTWALRAAGLPPNAVNAENLERVRPTLARWLPLVKVFDWRSPKTALLEGTADLGIVWSGEAVLVLRKDPKFEYVLPKEGAHRYVDSFAIPKGAPNPVAAHKLIDHILRPEMGVYVSKEFPSTNPNLAARKLLTKEELANPASYPPKDARLETFRDVGENAALAEKLVAELKGRDGG